MEWEPLEECLYYVLNATLRAENRQKLQPWLLFLKLILTALDKLPLKSQTIWRGVKCDLNQQYEVGKRYTWWSFSSCTASLAVLESDQFLGKQGTRTLFNIQCQNGRMIRSHSSVSVEYEVLLPPAVQIEVVSKFDPGAGLVIIQVKQVQAPFDLIEPLSTVAMIPTESSLHQRIPDYQNEYLQQLIARNDYLGRQGLIDVDIPYVLRHCLVGNVRESFDISVNRITDRGAAQIGTALEANITLKTLDMRQNLISDTGTRFIANALQNNISLTTIYLCENQIGDEGARYLAEALKKNATLQKLFLSRNEIGDIGTKHLTEALSSNSTLTTFDIHTNEFTDEGVKHLTTMLKQNQALTHLFLSENLITNVGVLLFLNTLCRNHRLKSLHVDNLDTSKECFRAIDNRFRNNYALSELWLSQRSYSIDEQSRFQEIVKRKPVSNHFLP